MSDYIVTSRCVSGGGVSPLCLNYNDEVVLSGWSDGKLRMFRNENGKQIWQIDNAHKGGAMTLTLSNNLKFMASGGNEGEVNLI